MIVTVTPNPALDLTYRLGDSLDLASDAVHRAGDAGLEASGKGVNVARTLVLAGTPTVAVLPVGGATGRHLLDLLAGTGVTCRGVPQRGETRVNTTVLHAGGTLKVNGPGARLEPDEVQALQGAAKSALTEAAGFGSEPWLAICGSVPAGTPFELVGELVEAGRAAGARCAVDASGPAMVAAVEAGADLLAPNLAELRELAGLLSAPGGTASDGQPGSEVRPADGLPAEVVTAAVLSVGTARRTSGAVLVSLGAAGAVHSDGQLTYWAAGPAVRPVNTAGAGDALLSGFLADPPLPVAARLARAVAWGTVACLSPRTVCDAATGAADRIREVRVRDLTAVCPGAQDRREATPRGTHDRDQGPGPQTSGHSGAEE